MEHNFNESIDEFMDSTEIRVAEATSKAYWYNLNVIKKYLANNDILFLESFDRVKILSFIKHLKKTCKNTTINRRMRLLKKIYEYHDVNNSFIEKFRNLKKTVIHYDPFTEQQLRKIMNYVNSLDSKNPYELTRIVITLLLLDTGVRGSELLNIEVKNIDFDEQIIKLTSTKTKKQGYVFFTGLTKKLLFEYVSFFPERKYLLWNYYSFNRFTYRHLRTFMDRIKKECDLVKCHAHMFRHTFGTLMHNYGIQDKDLQELMRHENFETTEVYIKASYKQRHNSYKKYNIIDNLGRKD